MKFYQKAFLSTLFRDQSSFEIATKCSCSLHFHERFQNLWELYMFSKKYQIRTGCDCSMYLSNLNIFRVSTESKNVHHIYVNISDVLS